MTKFNQMEEIEVFISACKFIKNKPDFEINEQNFPYTAARAFKIYKTFMEAADVRRRQSEV